MGLLACYNDARRTPSQGRPEDAMTTERFLHGRPDAAAVLLVAGILSATPARADVVVEGLEPGSVTERAGLKPGDVLLRWERAASPPANPEPAGGTLASPFDVDDVEREQAPRGDVTLYGTRGGEALALAIPT